jgi:GNAT superfamily N-acetyltransferase
MQGLSADVALLESVFERKNIKASEQIEYDLMSLERGEAEKIVFEKGIPAAFGSGPQNPAERPPPPGLVIRQPDYNDIEGLFPLQCGYEQEEVLPKGAEFSAPACRKNLEQLIKNGGILMAKLDGFTVGKINLNAESFTRLQIGGVYVAPEFRGLGIAQSMILAMLRAALPRGKNFTLFVKKRNPIACRVYNKTGFTKTADYQIDYFL